MHNQLNQCPPPLHARTEHREGGDEERNTERRPRDIDAFQAAGIAALLTNGAAQTRKQEERAYSNEDAITGSNGLLLMKP